MGLTPGPDAFHVGGASEVIPVGGLLEPALLTGGFAGLAALGLETVALTRDTARVGNEEHLTVLTLTLADLTYHEPESPQVHDRNDPDARKEDGEKNGTGKRSKKMEESG